MSIQLLTLKGCVWTDMPAKYIYEPWTAPLAVQQKAKCIIGVDYPRPSTLISKLTNLVCNPLQ